MRFLVTGSIAFDLLLEYEGAFPDAIAPEQLDQLSVSFFAPHLKRTFGGTAANIAWNLGLLGQEVSIEGAVGEDGAAYLQRLQGAGIATERVEVKRDVPTAMTIVGTDNAERQIAFFHPGAAATRKLQRPTKGAFALAIVTPEAPEVMVRTALMLRSVGISYLFDPSQQVTTLSGDDLTRAIAGSAGIICNDYEWAILSEKTHRSTTELLEETSLLVITHGERGATVQNREGSAVVQACRPERTVNPTGAGDALRAGLLTGLARRWGLRQAIQLGCALASFVIEVEETQLETFSLAKLEDRYAETYGEELPRMR